MDYLGIDRALVWHTLARDLAPVAGNRLLHLWLKVPRGVSAEIAVLGISCS